MPYDPLTQLQIALPSRQTKFYGKSGDIVIQYPGTLAAYLSFVGSGSSIATEFSDTENIKSNFDVPVAALERQARLTAGNLDLKASTTKMDTSNIDEESVDENVANDSLQISSKTKFAPKTATSKEAQTQNEKAKSRQNQKEKNLTNSASERIGNVSPVLANPGNSNRIFDSPAGVYVIYVNEPNGNATQYAFQGEAAKSAKRLKAEGRLSYLLNPKSSNFKVKEKDYGS